MRKFILVLLALSLTGCASAAQQRAEETKRHDPYCKSIGAGPGTAGYANCRLQMRQMDQRAMSEMMRPDPPPPQVNFTVPQIYHPF